MTGIDQLLEFDRADRMRKALRVSGMSVQEVADEIEVYRNTVGNWINGHTAPRPRDLRAFARVTKVPVSWLENGTLDDVRPEGFEPPAYWSVACPTDPDYWDLAA